MAYTYSKIATVTVGSGGASRIDFLAIPQNYTDLLLKTSLRDNQAGSSANDNAINFNFSTTNFTGKRGYGNGTTAPSDTFSTGDRKSTRLNSSH